MNETAHIPPTNPTPRGKYALVDLHSGRAYPLQSGPNSIGRSARNQVVLEDNAVSRRHAVVMVHEDGKCEIGDAKSRNGVFLNGRRLQNIARLTLADLLQIDGFRLLFTRQSPTDSSPLSFTDETLGVVIWNAPNVCWHFGITLGVNRFAPATYKPLNNDLSLPDWEPVRAFVRQVKRREPEAKALLRQLSRSVGNWAPLSLFHVILTTTIATLIYHNSSDGSGCVSCNQEGEFVSAPVWVTAQRCEG